MKTFALWLALAMLSPLAAQAQTAGRVCPSDVTLRSVIANANLVLIGRMQVPEDAILETQTSKASGYIEIPIKIDHVLKGGDAQVVILRYYPENVSYRPSIASVLALSGQPALLSIKRIGEGPMTFYFAGSSPTALQDASASNVEAARAEISRQADIQRTWRPDLTLPHDRDVRRLVARLGKGSMDDQERTFAALEALGQDAVPALVGHMDDRRALAYPQISLRNNFPGAFEGSRHYGPKLVVDALSAILNQIAPASFGSIENGGTEEERSATVAGWRVYAADIRLPVC